MAFEIPPQYRDLPEAKRLLALREQFAAACAGLHRTVVGGAIQRDPDACATAFKSESEILDQLREAEREFDEVTGLPTPVPLSQEIEQRIEVEYPADDAAEIKQYLSKSLGYLVRMDVHDSRIPTYILHLARGKKVKALALIAEAVQDYRNIIFWVENAAESRLDTPQKKRRFQTLLRWLGVKATGP